MKPSHILATAAICMLNYSVMLSQQPAHEAGAVITGLAAIMLTVFCAMCADHERKTRQ